MIFVALIGCLSGLRHRDKRKVDYNSEKLLDGSAGQKKSLAGIGVPNVNCNKVEREWVI
jgi:hypothetical protein